MHKDCGLFTNASSGGATIAIVRAKVLAARPEKQGEHTLVYQAGLIHSIDYPYREFVTWLRGGEDEG